MTSFNVLLTLANKAGVLPEAYITAGVSPVKAGMRGAPKGIANSVYSTGVHQTIWNQAIAVLVSIVTNQTEVKTIDLHPQDSVYGEITKLDAAGNPVPVGYVINDQEIKSSKPLDNFDMLVALTSYFIGKNKVEFDEIRNTYYKCCEELKTNGKINNETALLFCDSFYFTSLKMLKLNSNNQPELKIGEPLTDEALDQLARSISSPKVVDFKPLVPIKDNGLKLITITVASTPTFNTSLPILERCKNGEFFIPYNWSEEDKALIPSINFLDLYIPSDDFTDALTLISHQAKKILENLDRGLTGEDAIGNYGKCLAFIGKPGTGKSTMIKALCAALQMPFYPCTTTRFSEEDEYQGKTKLDHSVGEGESVSFKFCETPFLNAFERGGIAVLEEFNLADPGMLMGAIGQAIEKPFIIEKDGYQPTKRHPLCIICFTCNVGTQGSQMPSEALFSRAPHVFSVEDPPEDKFIDILMKQTEGVTRNQVVKVFGMYNRLMNMLKAENMPELMKVLTLRHCLAALDQIAAGVAFKKATARTFINPLRVYAPEVADDFYKSIIDTETD